MPASASNKKRGLPEPSSAAGGSSAKKQKSSMDRNQKKYYAVRAGHRPGVYETWPECQQQTSGFRGAQYKSFLTREEAADFVAGKPPKTPTGPEKFYAVAVGVNPDIYTTWEEASEAIRGAKGPKYQKFGTREEAAAFIRQHGSSETVKQVLGEEKPEAAAVLSPAAKEPNTQARFAVIADSGVQVIYTDGSSINNGKANARAGVGVYFGVGDARNVSEPLADGEQTNQRAELMAILRALQIAPVTQPVCIASDSQYSIKSATVWPKGYAQKDWKTATGSPVKHKELILAILDRLAEREKAGTPTDFKWVKGHDTTVGNIAADKLARGGAAK